MEGWEDGGRKVKNTLPLYANKDSMNLNSMVLTNIVGSAYFKEELFQYKTFHEVVDQIYYKVDHLEPWEKNSRKLSGQVGMCAGVRGVAAGGIVSTAFCLLYKMFTLKLTRKQVTVMLNHRDSPYIRGIGFLYIRYCQPPANFWDWFSPYIEDEEEINLKAGGGYTVTVGQMCRMMLTSLDWFGTLFPRLPVLVQKDIIKKLEAFPAPERIRREPIREEPEGRNGHEEMGGGKWGEAARRAREEGAANSPRRPRERRSQSKERQRSRSRERQRSRDRQERRRSRSKERQRSRSKERQRSRSKERQRSRSKERQRSRDRQERQRSRSKERQRSRSKERQRSRSKERQRSRSKERQRSRSKERQRSRSKERQRSRDRQERHRNGSATRGRHRSRSRDKRQHSKSRDKHRHSSRERRRSQSRDRKRRRSQSNDRGHRSNDKRSRSRERRR